MNIDRNKKTEVMAERLKQVNVRDIDQMVELMLEMIQLTSKDNCCMELLP